MMTHAHFATVAILTVVLGGCSKERAPAPPQDSGTRYVTFAVQGMGDKLGLL